MQINRILKLSLTWHDNLINTEHNRDLKQFIEQVMNYRADKLKNGVRFNFQVKFDLEGQ